MCAAILVGSVGAPWFSRYSPNDQNIADRLFPPAWEQRGTGQHPLGTDQIGRDLLSRLLYGGRVSLLVSGGAALIAGTIGTFLGLIGAFSGGTLDSLVVAAIDAQLSLPFILLALAIVAAFGVTLVNVLVVLTVTWATFARVVRGRVLELREAEFVTAATAIGASDARILSYHILPHLVPLVIALLTVQVGRIILMESALSFLGLGVPAMVPSWGLMLSEGRQYARTAPWLTVLPGVAIVVLVLSINLLGRGMSNWLDPRRA